LLDKLKPAGPLLLGDPLHLRYLCGFYVDPFSLGADYGGYLLLKPDGHATLFHDHRLPKSVEGAFADARVPVKWYDGQSPGQGLRRLILRDVVADTGGRVHDAVQDEMAPEIWAATSDMRRAKDPDEVATLRQCMTAGEAGMAWARKSVRPGMSELDVYAGVQQACTLAAGRAVVVYGDFAVSPGSAKRGGPPTAYAIQPGDTLILDFSVVIDGYRSDFTNTLVVGPPPTAGQKRLFDACLAAMTAGEAKLKTGEPCQAVYDAVRGAFEQAGLADQFPHHAGHGLGLAHPEPPFLVRRSTETLLAGDVVTLEPGLYVDGLGGVRIEHNYLITAAGFERLSNHALSLS
jgi:Xaa-Pro aminopeptidase